jgi:hypothetical protein
MRLLLWREDSMAYKGGISKGKATYRSAVSGKYVSTKAASAKMVQKVAKALRAGSKEMGAFKPKRDAK